MRALRVVGLGIDGRTVILETVEQRSGERRERFRVRVPVDLPTDAIAEREFGARDQQHAPVRQHAEIARGGGESDGFRRGHDECRHAGFKQM